MIFHSAYQDIKNPFEVINDYQPFGYVMKGQGESEDLLAMVSRAIAYSQMIRRNKKIADKLARMQSALQEPKR